MKGDVEIMSKCTACEDKFIWSDQVVIVDDNYYHKDCVTLVPTGYYALINDEPLGETENEDGQRAWTIIGGLLDES